MSNIILENKGTYVSNLDDARFNRFCAGYKDGIIKKSFNECNATLMASNVIKIDKGELLISGFRVILAEKLITFSSLPSSDIKYYLIAKLQLDENDNLTIDTKLRTTPTLVKKDLFKEGASDRIYELELAYFIASPTGLSIPVKTLDFITNTAYDSDIDSILNGSYKLKPTIYNIPSDIILQVGVKLNTINLADIKAYCGSGENYTEVLGNVYFVKPTQSYDNVGLKNVEIVFIPTDYEKYEVVYSSMEVNII